jgi:hypothetical protein
LIPIFPIQVMNHLVHASTSVERLPRIQTVQCGGCGRVFEGQFSGFCSDQCLYDLYPELQAKPTKSKTAEVEVTASDKATSNGSTLSLAEQRQQRLLAVWQAGLDGRQRSYDFSKLKPKAKLIGAELLRSWQGEGVLLAGGSESGKTFVGYRLARSAFLQGRRVLCCSAAELRGWWLEDRNNLRPVHTVGFLLLDDLGMEDNSNGWCAGLYELLRARELDGVEVGGRLSTIITVNKSRDFYASRYSNALANRLWRMKIVEL